MGELPDKLNDLSFPELVEELCGDEAYFDLLRKAGGTRILVPKSYSPDGLLSDLIGAENAAKVIATGLFAEIYVTIPIGRAAIDEARRVSVDRLIKAGASALRIALAVRCSTRYVMKRRAALKAAGVELPPLASSANRRRSASKAELAARERARGDLEPVHIDPLNRSAP